LDLQLILSATYEGPLKAHLAAISAVTAVDQHHVTFQLADWVMEPDPAWFTVGISTRAVIQLISTAFLNWARIPPGPMAAVLTSCGIFRMAMPRSNCAAVLPAK